MFARAIEIDPGFVLAYAGLADSSSVLYTYWHARPADLEQADRASRRALEIDAGVAEAHGARGLALTLSKDYESAQREFEAAIRLDPRSFDAHYFYGRMCFEAGKLAEAARLFAQAEAVRSEDYQAVSLLEMVYRGLGRAADAAAARQRALRAIEQHLELNPGDARAWCMGALALSQLGNIAMSLAWADRALALDPDEGAVAYNAACLYALQGHPERAIELLEAAVDKGYSKPREWVSHDPDLTSLRDLPRFRALLERL
jgi:tetratricopeptide (TPR) repeat protein